MQAMEYAELWWANEQIPLLTFYRPSGTETVAVAVHDHQTLKHAMAELEQLGWTLFSASQHRACLLFQRRLA